MLIDLLDRFVCYEGIYPMCFDALIFVDVYINLCLECGLTVICIFANLFHIFKFCTKYKVDSSRIDFHIHTYIVLFEIHM